MVNLVPKTIRFLLYRPFSAFPHFSRVVFKPRDVIACTRLYSTSVSFTECEYDDEIPDDGKATEKHTALQMALSKLSGAFGEESMLSTQHFFGARRAPVISTGSLRLDQALGIGGLPRGRMIEIYGQEASGKTTLALHIIKEAQRLGGYCAYLDVENAMDPSFAESIGVNTDNLLISQPDSAENSLSVVDTLTKSGAVDVIVVDSVAALVPQIEVEAMSFIYHRDLQSKIMTQALRKIHYSLCRSNTLIVFINQVRRSLRLEEGSICGEEVTCGGNALKFYAAVRLRISRKGLLRSNNKVTGLGISVQVIKNKLAPPMAKAELNIQFGKGFFCESEALDLACEYGILSTEGSGYLLDGKVFVNKEDAVSYLAANKGALDAIIKNLRYQLFEQEN